MTSPFQKAGDHYIRRLVTRVTSMGRAARLRRQFGEIEQRSLELPRSYREQLAELIGRECDSVEAAADPSIYGTQTENGVTTSGLDLGFDRARSDNVQVRMRGIALWIALVYRETRNAEAPESQELHRAILRVMRELKVFSSRVEGGGNPS
ncbi:MAG TPA: hypothetical protein VHD89_12080 [Rhodanobacteraceae bacterium]|nr:hypothetical protein [Rhodanobacteraceae bacterium]